MEPEYLTPIEVPDGNYTGKWSGHTLQFDHDGETVFVQTVKGVRGLNVPVTFTSRDNQVDEESIETIKSDTAKELEWLRTVRDRLVEWYVSECGQQPSGGHEVDRIVVLSQRSRTLRRAAEDVVKILQDPPRDRFDIGVQRRQFEAAAIRLREVLDTQKPSDG